MEEPKLELIRRGMQGITIKLDDKVKEINDPEVVQNIYKWFRDQIEFFQQMSPIIKHYDNFDEKVDSFLDKQEEDWKLEDHDTDCVEYSVSGNYALFLGFNKNLLVDNIEAGEFLKKEFTDGDISFEPAMDFCFAYTTDRETAKRFLLWMYHTYIKDFIKKMSDPNYNTG